MRLAYRLLAVLLLASPSTAVPAQATAATDARRQESIGRDPAPLRRAVTLDLRDAPLLEAVRSIDRQAGLGLGYTDRLLAGHRVTLAVTGVPATEALQRVLAGTGIALRVSARGHLTLVRAPDSTAAVVPDTAFGALLGIVSDSVSREPVRDVRVTLRGTGLAVRTDANGYYVLPRVPAGPHTVQLRMVGYRPVDHNVVVPEGEQLRIDLSLAPGLTRLQEVVTTATGARRRVELGSDVTVLNADSITSTQIVRSVTELMATRVPGMTAMRTSGAPGDPMRIRLRGMHSVFQNDDPIVVVDGVRIYSQQSAERSANLAEQFASSRSTPAPSPLDQIDPNSIETLEVIKGPSAATLYGADAANGVIVITTKRGRAGPPRWTLMTDYGQTEVPGSYPESYFSWGHSVTHDDVRHCDLRNQTCVVDSLVAFQMLNDPRYTVLGRGERRSTSLGVSGGSAGLSYSFTGTYGDETGYTRLPGYELDRFRQMQGVDAPGWMSRPHRYDQWSGTASLSAQASATLNIGLTTMLSRSEQGRSSLEQDLPRLMRVYVDSANGTFWQAEGSRIDQSNFLFGHYYRRVTAQATTLLNGLTVTWTPRPWLTASSDAGLQLMERTDRMLVPRGMIGAGADSVGVIGVGQGRALTQTLNARVSLMPPRYRGVQARLSLGLNYTSTALDDVRSGGRGLAVGSSTLTGAEEVDPPQETSSTSATAGFYIEPSIDWRGLYVSTGLRFDGGSTFGSRASLPRFPKLGLSYLVSDQPFFPEQSLVSALRLRMAYGQAGVQPGVGDHLRLYTQEPTWNGTRFVDGTIVETLGNTKLRPERSEEIEAGIDIGLFDDRVSIEASGYRSTRSDALIPVPVPPSVYGDGLSVLRNIGVIRNTGLEASLTAQVLQRDAVSLSTGLSVSRNRNRVVSLAPGVSPFYTGVTGVRVAPGYPLFGRWTRPIIGYEDVNRNGLITADEVQVGDTAVFMGETIPNYRVRISPSASFLRGAITVSAGLDYEDGLTQVNRQAMDGMVTSRALNDPNAPFGEQAAVAAMHLTDYGMIQTVSTFRFNELAVSYRLPARYVQRLGSDALSIAVQGHNLGLRTNYRGKDPNVNAYSSGNDVADTGMLPLPRTWQLRVSAAF